MLEKRHFGDYFLILGLARSGTSFLSSLMGGHPDINMLSETYDSAITRTIGKRYTGNKLCAHQIRYDQFSPIPKRIVTGANKLRTVSKLLFVDYIDLNAKIILILRNLDDVKKSIMTRTSAHSSVADVVIEDGLQLIKKIDGNHRVHHVGYEALCRDKPAVLKDACSFLGLDYSEKMLTGEKYNWVYPERKV
jgi:hypothetical protein